MSAMLFSPQRVNQSVFTVPSFAFTLSGASETQCVQQPSRVPPQMGCDMEQRPT